ncbi:hypothetical protein AB2B41_00420 [Marimonas sp. MJW-29]|uniref:Tyrosine specific protein phosphatases domain-containing protein n=1 Tax=Sulfitobacter sediminis TaxID=3234186 RepID=A0ABV3RGG5_9RHOB
MAALAAEGVTDVLSMLPDDEAEEIGVGEEPAICAALGLRFHSHPIPDFCLPERHSFIARIADILQMLGAGRHLAVHCRAGIGRSGMIATATLIGFGQSAEEAIARVAQARGVSIPDTEEQAGFIRDFEKHWAERSAQRTEL